MKSDCHTRKRARPFAVMARSVFLVVAVAPLALQAWALWPAHADGRRGPSSGAGQSASEASAQDSDYGPRALFKAVRRLWGGAPPTPESATPAHRPAARRSTPSEVLAFNLSEKAAEVAARLGFHIEHRTQLTRLGLSVAHLRAPQGMEADKASAYLKAELPEENFAPNRTYRLYQSAMGNREPPESIVDASRHPSKQEACLDQKHCYGSSLIRWNADVQSCAKGVKVGVIDTGADLDHPALAQYKANVAHVLPRGKTQSPNAHGTGVLAMLAGDPASGTPGLIPTARIYIASVFFNDSEGSPVTNTASMLGALDLMKQFDVQVVNLSLSGPKDAAIEKTITEMARNGVIFVAAAGNEGPAAEPVYPAAYPSVIAVTAVDDELRGYRYANRGPYIDLAAPGVRIWTALPGRKEGYQSGTSFAAPYVTAMAAAVYSHIPGVKTKQTILNAFAYRLPPSSEASETYGRGLLMAPAFTARPPDPCSIMPSTTAPAVAAIAPFQTESEASNAPRARAGKVRPAGN